jgi:hypothetical protein
MSLACRACLPRDWPAVLPGWGHPCSCLRPCGDEDCRPTSYVPVPPARLAVAPVQSRRFEVPR